MPDVTLDGIRTHYLTQGSGPALLMLAPRGFNATMDGWRMGKWKEIDALESLARHFTLIAYDRRESGLSGGRVEVLSFEVWARQAKALLEHLGHERAWVLGQCMGSSLATKFAAMYPGTALGVVIGQPVGGYHWQRKGLEFYDRHIAFVRTHGLQACVGRSPRGRNFWEDPEPGPWAAQLCSDPAFTDAFVKQDAEAYLDVCARSRDVLFPDRHVAGASAEELLRIDAPVLVWPGDDERHTVSAAQQVRELVPRVEYCERTTGQQSGQEIFERILAFRERVESGDPFRKAA